MIYTLQDLESGFDEDWVSKGSLVLNEHAVEPNVQRGGELLTAMIDTGRQRIRVYVKVRVDANGELRIEGDCSCPAQRNCRHVSAVLLKALLDGDSDSLEELERLEARVIPPQDYPPEVRQRLIYVLELDPDDTTTVRLATRCVRATDGGTYADDRRYEPAWAQRGTPPRFLLQVDREILVELCRPKEPSLALRGAFGERLLRAILATGRCHLGSVHGPALGLASPQAATPVWVVDSNGSQRLSWGWQPVFFLESLWHLDDAAARCVPLQTDLPDALIGELMILGSVAPDQVSRITSELQQGYPEIVLPALQRIEIKDHPAVRPRPCLHLCDRDGPAAELSFEYHGIRVGAGSPVEVFKDGVLIRLSRDELVEQSTVEQLVALGLSKQVDPNSELTHDRLMFADDPLPWLVLQQRDFAALETQGWCCSVASDFSYRLARPEHWYGELETLQSENYGLSLGVRLDGCKVNLLPVLVAWLSKQPPDLTTRDRIDERGLPLPLPDGRYLLLSRNRLDRILDALFELYDERLDELQRLRLNRFQLARLTELERDSGDDEPLHWLGDEQLRALAHRLRAIETIPAVAVPQGLRTVLRPYQQQGLDWLQFLREHRLAGILADDMGLGKTVQALAHLLREKEQGRLILPSLVIAPTSLMDNWRRAAQRFAPDLRVSVLHGPRRHALFDDLARQDLVITTYPLLLRDHERLLAKEYYLLILDEAQVVKNPRAKASGIIRECNARHRLCLTGTPLENHLGELWSLFDFLLPGLLGNERQFRLRCRKPIEDWGDERLAERLRRRIRPFLLRRTKQEVTPELPAKTEILHRVELTTEQRALYEDIRLAMYRRVRAEVDDKGIGRCGITILSALLKLRQVCCDPRLLSPAEREHATASAKLEWLRDLLPEMIEEGRRVLLFSQFTSMLALIESAVRELDIDFVKLTGDTRDRATPVGCFQSGAVSLFLVSLKAGGVGLNLTAADTVIHYDPWWNPAAERQATDRAHRIGQENPVFVYKLISAGTVEERIQTLQERKQALADGLYDSGGGANPQWTEEDVEELFRPLV